MITLGSDAIPKEGEVYCVVYGCGCIGSESDGKNVGDDERELCKCGHRFILDHEVCGFTDAR